MKQKVRYVLERLIAWSLERCILRQAWVITREFARLTNRAQNIESVVKFVFSNHWQHITDLEQRLSKLEGKAVN